VQCFRDHVAKLRRTPKCPSYARREAAFGACLQDMPELGIGVYGSKVLPKRVAFTLPELVILKALAVEIR
jgi:hypothetical protein